MFGLLVQLDTTYMYVKFEGQGQRSEFTVAGGKMLLKWSVRPRVKAFYF